MLVWLDTVDIGEVSCDATERLSDRDPSWDAARLLLSLRWIGCPAGWFLRLLGPRDPDEDEDDDGAIETKFGSISGIVDVGCGKCKPPSWGE